MRWVGLEEKRMGLEEKRMLDEELRVWEVRRATEEEERKV